MGDGSDKPPTPADAQRRVALARRLTSGNRVPPPRSSGESAGGLKYIPSSPPPAPPSSPIPAVPSSPPPGASSSRASISPAAQPGAAGPRTPGSERGAPSVRDAVLAARRDAVVDPRMPGAPRPPEEQAEVSQPKPEAKRKVRPAFLFFAGLSLVAALVVLVTYGKSALYQSSPEGRVHEALIDWEMAPAAQRDSVFAKLDQLGPSALPHVLGFLRDGSPAERGESHSTRSLREIAQLYLMHVAATAKVPPPKVADELSKSLFAGNAASDAQWGELRDAWRGWVEEQQAKGTLPKP